MRGRAGLLLVTGLLLSCGPTPPPDGASSGGTAATDSGIILPPTTAAALESSGEPPPPIGLNCPENPPPVEVPLPPGCQHMLLVDEDRNPLADSPSGLVRCPEPPVTDPEPFAQERFLLYRTAAVPCPFATGDCLCDADCPMNYQCICDNQGLVEWRRPGNVCMPADCASEEDCSGLPCRVDEFFCGTGGPGAPAGLYCMTPSDDCTSHSECPEKSGGNCSYDGLMEFFTCDPGAICE